MIFLILFFAVFVIFFNANFHKFEAEFIQIFMAIFLDEKFIQQKQIIDMHIAYIHGYEMVSFFYGNSFESLFMELVLKKATSVSRMHIPFFQQNHPNNSFRSKKNVRIFFRSKKTW